MDVPECHLAQRTGASIFLQAMKEGKVQLAHFILVALGEAAANAPLDSEVAAGRTLLMYASMLPRINERACFMQLLLGRGADVQRQDGASRTALSLASQHGYMDAVRLLVLHGAWTNTLDNMGRSPLDYAVEGHHEDVTRFLINESKGSNGQGPNRKVAVQTRESDGEQMVETFVNGLSRPLCQTSVSYPLPIDKVICNPFALYKEEERKILRHDYRKPTKPSNTALPNPSQVPLYDQIFPEEKAPPCTTEQFSKLHQLSPKVSSKNGFLPGWMKRSPTCPLKSLSTESAISKPTGSFSKRMASKMALSSTSSLRESQTNLLIPEGEVMDSTSSKLPQDLSARKLRSSVTDTVLQNHCFLEENSRWTEHTDRFPKNEFERWGYTQKLHPNHIKWSRLPRDKYLSSMRNAVNYLSQSEQNSALSRSGCNVFRALRTCTYPELRFLQMGQLDPEQEALVRGEHSNSSDFLE